MVCTTPRFPTASISSATVLCTLMSFTKWSASFLAKTATAKMMATAVRWTAITSTNTLTVAGSMQTTTIDGYMAMLAFSNMFSQRLLTLDNEEFLSSYTDTDTENTNT